MNYERQWFFRIFYFIYIFYFTLLWNVWSSIIGKTYISFIYELAARDFCYDHTGYLTTNLLVTIDVKTYGTETKKISCIIQLIAVPAAFDPVRKCCLFTPYFSDHWTGLNLKFKTVWMQCRKFVYNSWQIVLNSFLIGGFFN